MKKNRPSIYSPLQYYLHLRPRVHHDPLVKTFFLWLELVKTIFLLCVIIIIIIYFAVTLPFFAWAAYETKRQMSTPWLTFVSWNTHQSRILNNRNPILEKVLEKKQLWNPMSKKFIPDGDSDPQVGAGGTVPFGQQFYRPFIKN